MRQSCPNDERIIDYIEGRLSEEDRSHLEKHISACEMCLEELVITNNIVTREGIYELEPPPAEVTEAAVDLLTGRRPSASFDLIDYLRNFSIKLVAYTLNPIRLWRRRQWHPAPVRGYRVAASEDYACLEVSYNGIDTLIEIEKSAVNKANIRLRLKKPIQNPKSLRVTLANGQKETASYLLDGNYVFFEDIPFGRYSISLTKNHETIGAYSFEIKESSHGGRETQK